MPRDVALGEGYGGDALAQAFPGQYRDSAAASAQQQFPGAVSGQPRYTDPDQGRPMALTNIPGVGQVVVPVEHTMIGQVVDVEHRIAGLEQVYPAEHSMVGQVYPAEHQMAALGPDVVRALARAANGAAVQAARGVRLGLVRSAAQFAAQVRSGTAAARDQIAAARPGVRRALAMVAEHVSAETVRQWRPRTEALGLPTTGALRDFPTEFEARAGVGDWRSGFAGAGGLGGLAESIASLAAGRELDDLNRAVLKLHDNVFGSYKQLDALEPARAEVRELTKLPGLWIGMGVPTPKGRAVAEAEAAVREGYRALTGFTYMTTAFAESFGLVAPQLRKAYGGLDGLLDGFRLWRTTANARVLTYPGMGALFDRIQTEHRRRYAEARPGRPIDYNDPVYLSTAQDAVAALAGYKAAVQRADGMSDFGITALIAIIAAAVALVAVVAAAVLIVRELNAKVRYIHEQRLEYERVKAREREDYVARRVREGAAAQQAAAEWDALKKKYDADQDRIEAGIRETPGAGDVLAQVAKYALPAAVVIGAAIVLPQVL